MSATMEAGRACYESYSKWAGVMPQDVSWNRLPPHLKEAWANAALEGVNAYRNSLARQIAELKEVQYGR